MKVNDCPEKYADYLYLTGSWDDSWRKNLISSLPENIPYFDSKNAKYLESMFVKEDSLMIIYVVNSDSLSFFTALDVFLEALKEPTKFLFCSLTLVPRKRVLFLEKALIKLGAIVSRNLDDVANIICKTYSQSMQN